MMDRFETMFAAVLVADGRDYEQEKGKGLCSYAKWSTSLDLLAGGTEHPAKKMGRPVLQMWLAHTTAHDASFLQRTSC